jgi:hypothetical protein
MAAAGGKLSSTGGYRDRFAADVDFLGFCRPSGLGSAQCVDQGPPSGRCVTHSLNGRNDDLGMKEPL